MYVLLGLSAELLRYRWGGFGELSGEKETEGTRLGSEQKGAVSRRWSSVLVGCRQSSLGGGTPPV